MKRRNARSLRELGKKLTIQPQSLGGGRAVSWEIANKNKTRKASKQAKKDDIERGNALA